MKRYWSILLLIFIGFQSQAQLDPIAVDIPMSDGMTLAGDLYLPNEVDAFPTIFIFTSYGKIFYTFNGLPLGIGEDIENSDYAFLIVDWRCRFASLPACAPDSDDGEDGHDVVEWIADQAWSDGQVGLHGPSALGGVQFKVARTQPPHLTCCVPEVASPQATYLKYYPGGSLNLETVQTLDVLFPGALAPIIAFPYDNFIWQAISNDAMYPSSITVPMLLVGGWYDQNISQVILWSDTLADVSSAASQHKTLIGPWVHGGTGQAHLGSSNQGELEYPEAEYWNEAFAWQFFDYHMRGIDNGWDNRSRYTYFQMGDQEWNHSDVWPPTNGTVATYYLHEDNSISSDPPTSDSASLTFEYDPNDPSPTHGGKTLNLDQIQGPLDQSDTVETRNDNLIFTTPIITEDLNIKGKIEVDLFVSSDMIDTDFVVRLTEVYPDGRSMLLSDHIQRMRFREGYRLIDTTFMSPTTVYEVPIILEDLATTFKAGNQLRLIITSSNYPRFNRNMNTGGEQYPNSSIDTLVTPLIATNSIHLSSVHPSGLLLPLGVNTPIAIDESSEIAPEVEIFTNTAQESIIIRSIERFSLLELYDIDGRLIRSETLSSQSATLNSSGMRSGVYIIKVHWSNGRSLSRKLLID